MAVRVRVTYACPLDRAAVLVERYLWHPRSTPDAHAFLMSYRD